MNRRPRISPLAAVALFAFAVLGGCAPASDLSAARDEAGEGAGGAGEAGDHGGAGGAGAGAAGAGGDAVQLATGSGAGGAALPTGNIVPNGDFEGDDDAFGSDYAKDDLSGWSAGVYKVGTDGASWNPYWVGAGDHTSGHGRMLLANGKETPDRVWYLRSPVAVKPGTTYYFEAWVMAECCDADDSAVLSFYANDELLGTRTASGVGQWVGLGTTWSSGSATSVTLKIVNANTELVGNDFAIDDVFLGTTSSLPTPE